MDEHHLDIIRLAWARHLGLGDSALRATHTARVIEDTTEVIHILRLADADAVVGPRWFMERTADADIGTLLEPPLLLELTKDHGGRIASHTDLAFLSDYTDTVPTEQLLISHERADALAVAQACPPDDAVVADLDDRERWFTALNDDHQPLSCAAYREFQGFVADLTMLTVPAHRRHKLACGTTFLATEDALDAGLVPQLRIPDGHRGGAAIARELGFTILGIHATVAILSA
ncbi:GNAT family N-acetyltransferase [Rhodococcus sp. ARC_M6]|uniref:GNAT family N-acetyltransferase n=1 Tax=Rhodococcus sp. ARC_M6 TaxID=2928852 RepID=UPI001FB301D7|nr:GNAT family N-acetyltransferase [Rhodococcus sp. ARC_M6]MCJ0904722.1 GNAT family N-acetyltransferase [Rhodococcus sp. ARC_M6]